MKFLYPTSGGDEFVADNNVVEYDFGVCQICYVLVPSHTLCGRTGSALPSHTLCGRTGSALPSHTLCGRTGSALVSCVIAYRYCV